MRAFIIGHSYLLCSVAYTACILALGFVTLPRPHFQLLVHAGLANAPAGLFLWFLEGNYWTPPRLGGLRLGVEDLLISYAVGALGWYVVAIGWRKRLRFRLDLAAALRRYIAGAIVCNATFLVAVWTGLNPFAAMLLTCGLVGGGLGWVRRDSWPLAATGVTVFPAVWFAVVAFCVWLFPEFLPQWNLHGPWGRPFAGVPCGEIAWAVVFGLFWPLFVGCVYDVAIHPIRRPGV